MFQPKLQLTAHEEAELVPTAAWVQAAIPRCCARCALRLSGATRPDLYACTTAALVAATGLLAAEPVDPPRRHDGYSCCPVCLGFLGCLDDDRDGHENSGGGCGVTPAAVGGPEATAVTAAAAAAAASSSPPAETAAAAAASSASIGLRAELLRSKALAGHQDVSGFRLHLQVPPELELRDQAAKCFLQKRAAATTTTTVAAAAAASAAAGALAPPIDTETSAAAAAAAATETAVAEAAGTTAGTTETAATASCQEIGGTTLLPSSSSSSPPPPPPQVAQTTNVWLRSFAAPGGGGHGMGWCVELKDALKWRLSARLSSCALEGLPRLLNTSYDGREASSSSSGQSATPEDVAGVDLLLAPTKHAVALPRALPTTETETVAEGSKKSPVPLSPASDSGLALANLLGFDCSSSSSNDSFGDGDYGYGASGGGGKGKGKRKQWWNKQSNNKSSSGSSNGGGGGGGDAASTPVSTALLALPEAAEMLKQCVALVRGAGGGRESLAAWFESLLSPPKPQPQLQLQPQPLWSCTWSRAPLLIGGRYRKLKRDVPQSKWIIQGEGRKGRGSVEECLALHVAAAFGVKPCAPNTCDMAEDGLSYLKPNSKQQPQELQQQPQPQKQDESSSPPPLLSGGVKFHAAGREDMDVLMLGRGRPFILEVIDAKTLHPLKPRLILKQQEPLSLSPPTSPPHLGLELYGSLPSIQARINNVDSVDTDNTSGMAAAAGEATSSGCRHGLDVECEALQHVRRSVYDEIIAGAEEKKKTYGCVVWASSPLVDQELLKQAFAGVCDLEINQDTPIRVLHRRTPMVRKKTIHALTPTFIKPHWFELEVEASAGTYIKEFVHGDLGRTSPSVGDLLREALAKKLVALQRQKIIGLQLDELENGTGTQPEESGHGEQTLPPHKKPKREGAAAAPLEDDGDASDAAAADAAVRVAVAGAAATEEQEEEGEEARSLRVDILQLDVKAVHTTGLLA